MRNLIAFEIAKRLGMKFVPYGQAVDVILNGEYKGCYQLCDQVEVKEGRVDITEMDENDNEGEALTGGYLVEVDAYADQEPAGEWFQTKGWGIPVTIKSPDDGGTAAQYNYIKQYFEELETRVLYGISSEPGEKDYRNIFDIESFLQPSDTMSHPAALSAAISLSLRENQYSLTFEALREGCISFFIVDIRLKV